MNSSELLEYLAALNKRRQTAITNHEYKFAKRVGKEISEVSQCYGEQILKESKEEEERKAIRGIFQDYESTPVKMNMKNAEDSAIERIIKKQEIQATHVGMKSLQSPGCEICCPVCHPEIGSPDPSARHSHSSIINCWHFCKNKYSQDGQRYWLDRMLSHVTLDFPDVWGESWGNVSQEFVNDIAVKVFGADQDPWMHNSGRDKNTKSGIKEWIKEPISTATPIRFALSVGLLFAVVAFACLGFGALVALLVAVL